jgi:hypothetical protein
MLGLMVAAEIVNVAVATGPLPITVVVSPNKTHCVDPTLPMQVMLFPAAVTAGLGTTVTLVTSAE